MTPKEFYDLAVKMRYVQKKFFAAKDKEEKQVWLRASRAYERQMDDEIDRVNGIIKRQASEYYELEDSEGTRNRVGDEFFELHIEYSLIEFFMDGKFDIDNPQHRQDHVHANGFFGNEPSPTLVINDLGDRDGDDMLEFKINLGITTGRKLHLEYLARLKG